MCKGIRAEIVSSSGLTYSVKMLDGSAYQAVSTTRTGARSYVVVRTVVEAASAGDVVEVRVEREGDDVVVETTGGGAVDPVRLADRVGAVGGEVVVAAGAVRAVVPCA